MRTTVHVLALWMPLSAACVAHFSGCSMEVPDQVRVSGHGGDCALCHVDEWSATRSPPHQEANLSQQCDQCHSTTSWTPASGYQHTAAFPLTLGHSGVACVSCHARGFDEHGTPHDCADCHADAAASVSDPVHAGLTTDCFACHRTDSFWPAHFVHAWPLKGKHRLIACRSCHEPEDLGQPHYEQTPSACLSCHAANKQHADDTVAGHAQYPDTCADCHGFDSFRR